MLIGFSSLSKVYNWSAEPPNNKTPFVPMIWGKGSLPAIEKLLATKDEFLLGFNEPDLPEQANLTVENALFLWKNLETTNRSLGSPSVAFNALDKNGWFANFMNAVKLSNLTVDFICLHFYTNPYAANAILDIIDKIHLLYGLPIWVTELAVADFQATKTTPTYITENQVILFMNIVLPGLYARSFVHRFAWFSGIQTLNSGNQSDPMLGMSALFSRDSLTNLGLVYSRFNDVDNKAQTSLAIEVAAKYLLLGLLQILL